MKFTRRPSAFAWALVASVLVHALVLLVHRQEPKTIPIAAPRRLEAYLPSRRETQNVPQSAALSHAEAKSVAAKAKQPSPSKRVLVTRRPSQSAVLAEQKWSPAERAEMNQFLDSLATEAKTAAKPDLAQRAMAMAREMGRQMEREDQKGKALFELRPNALPPDPFSLEMYLDGLLKHLNRSAAYVKHDPRSNGIRPASLLFKLNPDGSLRSFEVVNEGDQAAEIAFIKAVIDKAIPFAPFPADINKSIRSLSMLVCIHPGSSNRGGFGFSRAGQGQGC